MTSTGMARWREIGDRIIEDIDSGALQPGHQLPPTRALAERFGCNRNTVLRAVSFLQDHGLLRVEQGRGTFIAENVVEYRMGSRTTFEDNLSDADLVPSRKAISVLNLPAPEMVARQLRIASGSRVVEMALLGSADGVPVNFGRYYFPLERLPQIEAQIQAAVEKADGAIFVAKLLKTSGVSDFRRDGLRIRTCPPSAEVAHQLKVPRTEYVLEVQAVNLSSEDQPVMFADVFHAGSRVEFVLGF
ncbi:MAG: phosphonate metabolism transcriptional regulator PhnF [Hyphomonas sp.]|nr:phosphonate metabolism transcriptional regulator PhnF [Hyphomonas sp.]